MRVPVNWLREYVDIDATVKDLADRLTFSGTEVEAIEYVGPEYDGLVGDVSAAAEGPEPVFVLEVTPNRPDCLSIIGMAREVAALYGVALRIPETGINEGDTPVTELAAVEVTDTTGCPRYTARVLSGASNVSSPAWMQVRLIQAGIRPISAIVDITNYVMLECGYPLHAFDYRLLKEGRIIVRRAVEGEKMATLDGEDRDIASDMLMIADAENPVAIAGVMGGAGSEISEHTEQVLLEAAAFDPGLTRRTSAKLGLSTESSYRFERGVDPEGVDWASRRATSLLCSITEATAAKGVIDIYSAAARLKIVRCRYDRISGLIGTDIPAERMRGILEALSFTIDVIDDESFDATVPTFRPDIDIEADIVEEIARVNGLDDIEVTAPRGRVIADADDRGVRATAKVADALAGLGLNEILNYSFVSPALVQGMDTGGADRRILLPNPISSEQSILRDSLIPQMIESLGRNAAHQAVEAALFEIGRVYGRDSDGAMCESSRVCVGVMGPVGRTDMAKRKPVDPGESILWTKGILESLCESLNVAVPCLEPREITWARKGYSAALLVPSGDEVGVIGTLSDELGQEWRMGNCVSVLEISLDYLLEHVLEVPAAQDISVYPSLTRDMAIIADAGVSNADVLEVIHKVGPPELTGVKLFDIYQEKGLGVGKRSLAYSFSYCSTERTLTDDEANELHEAVKASVAKELAVKVRES